MACSFRRCWKGLRSRTKGGLVGYSLTALWGLTLQQTAKDPEGSILTAGGAWAGQESRSSSCCRHAPAWPPEGVRDSPQTWTGPWLENGRNLLKQFSEHEEIAAASYTPSEYSYIHTHNTRALRRKRRCIYCDAMSHRILQKSCLRPLKSGLKTPRVNMQRWDQEANAGWPWPPPDRPTGGQQPNHVRAEGSHREPERWSHGL